MVVLFNSAVSVLGNIETYLRQVDVLYVVDNSTVRDETIIASLKQYTNVRYVGVGRNAGIAAALNIGARIAIEDGYGFLLTMDDDSRAAPDMVRRLRAFLSARGDRNDIGIVSPYHFYTNYSVNTVHANDEVNTVITSGSLLNLRAFEKVGPFREELFIDYVDFEYCLRLQTHGYKIFRVGEALLFHTLGRLISHTILFKRVGATHHPAIRLYYRTRNRLYLYQTYLTRFPAFVLFDIVVFFNELIKIALYEPDKREKMKMIINGFGDFLAGKFGEYSEG